MGVALVILISIFKVILVVFLVILSVIIFLLLLLLFLLSITIYYELHLTKEKNINYAIEIKWLFKTLVVSKGVKGMHVSFFNRQIYPRIKKKRKSKKTLRNNEESAVQKSTPPIQNEPIKDEPTPKEDNVIPQKLDGNEDIKIEKQNYNEETKFEFDEDDTEINDETVEKEKNIFGKDFIIKYVLELGVLNAVLRLIIRILKGILPKKLAIAGTIGFTDPSITGGLLGALYAFCGAFNIDNTLTGNFDSNELKLDFSVKGRANLMQLIFYLILFLLDKYIFRIVLYYLRNRKGKKSN